MLYSQNTFITHANSLKIKGEANTHCGIINGKVIFNNNNNKWNIWISGGGH